MSFTEASGRRPRRSCGGRGNTLIDAAGKTYLDACGGAAVSCVGHDNAEVIEAITEQLGRLAFAHSGFFTTDVAEALADHLVTRAPRGTGAWARHVRRLGVGGDGGGR